MNLKELHIRNIASIERADIDFENALNDPATGTQATIFLIAGDTGAGKSVVLDGIAMALYKKTPRIADVANSIRNDYTDAEGESIRVASIEQYTRLGIAEKDESYSEVVFEGNDHKTYRARLTLGMMLGSRDKTTGLRPLKHRPPRWEVRVDDGDWTKDDVEQTILRAVGLDFQQFGRMAMLAQGQFANFLTGDKKEREAILEQLTNTQHFTAYGEAIQSLFKKAREALAQVQTQYDTEKPHTLTDEEVELTTQELKLAEHQAEQYRKEREAIETTLKLTATVLEGEKTRQEAMLKKQQIEAAIQGDNYKRSKALFTDWDATTEQRQHLTNLQRARQEELGARSELQQLKATFGLLSADLEHRQACLTKRDEDIRQMQRWTDERMAHQELFAKAGETDMMIGQYAINVKKVEELTAATDEEKRKTDVLKKAETAAAALLLATDKAVKERQDEIDILTGKRTALNPQAVNEELKKQNDSRQHLKNLQISIDNLKPLREDNLRLQADIKAEAEVLGALREACRKADADYEAKKLSADKAVQRLTTMRMSLDDKIKELRHRLYDEHAEQCPLCGQHIGHIHLDDDFKDMLTPLETEQQQAEQMLRQAATARDKARSDFSQAEGGHKSKLSQAERNTKKIEKAQQAIDAQALQAGLTTGEDLSQQIGDAIGRLTTDIARLEAAQSEAERLQREINSKQELKKPFDQRRAEAEKAKLKAENDVRANAEAIDRLEKERDKLAQECETEKTDISTRLKGYADHWLPDTDALRQRLKDDAKAYLERQKQLGDARAQQERDATLIASLRRLQSDVVTQCGEWQPAPTPLPYTCRDIQAEWTALLSKVTARVTKVNDSKAVIGHTGKALAAYYEATGKSEETLRWLMAQEAQVAAARRTVGDTDAALQSRNDAIADAGRQIATAFASLGISSLTELPDKQMLEEKKAALGTLRDEALRKSAQAKGRLDTHQANIMRLKEIEQRLDAARQHFARWEKLNSIFGGTRFRTLVQTHILRPLLNNANVYLEQITDRYRLTCSETNEQLSILVLDRYNKNQVRSVTVLSGGERFMISLALSLALSSLGRSDMNVNILFIDEGFGTLDEKSLDSVMSTLEKLQEIAGQTHRRVGIISHREELEERIPVKIQVVKKGEGRSLIEVKSA